MESNLRCSVDVRNKQECINSFRTDPVAENCHPHQLPQEAHSFFTFWRVMIIGIIPSFRVRTLTRSRHIPDPGDRLYRVSRCAEACATIFDHLQPCNFVFIPDLAAFACDLGDSNLTRFRPQQPSLRSFMLCRSMRDSFRLPTTDQPHFHFRPRCTHPHASAIAANQYRTARAPQRPTNRDSDWACVTVRNRKLRSVIR
ncbi:hypothetical protein EDB83DRAFT_2377418 [Lactarius deliciosus]|nr:hypothetical protein EDB83DRAFT_2377418 [Lactarius deliciosus]